MKKSKKGVEYTMKNPFSQARARYNDIPLHRRIKYNVLWVLAVIALVVITVNAIIDMNKADEIDTSDPIGSYDTEHYIPVVFEDDTVIVDTDALGTEVE